MIQQVLWLSALIVCFSVLQCVRSDDPVVEIEDGKVKGTTNITVGQNKTYYAFRGIPYAQPPIDDLRFKAPQKNDKWNGTLYATEDKSECVQNSSPVTGSEDCLYINVYTPTLEEKNLSVMVWIYGGAFIGGNSSYEKFGPDYLLDEDDVVFVSFNYRVGVFGFLSTEDLECPGNWGLKDQVLALQWVQDNIKYFGGNPQNVTIFGESAGSASVSYLLQSNLTKGLFQAAIMESGTSLNLWALCTRANDVAFAIGTAFGVLLTSNSTAVLEKLRTIDYEELQVKASAVADSLSLTNPMRGFSFGPVIEPEHEGAFFVNNSDQLLRAGGFHKVPMIIGFNSNEGAAAGSITFLIRTFLLTYDIRLPLLTPYDMTDGVLTKTVVGTKVKAHYFGILPIAASTEHVIEYISDDQFNRPIIEAVRQISNYTNVYTYVFSHEGILSGVTDRNFEGVGHAEELEYIFRSTNNYTDEDVLTRSRMVRMWTNFAKYGNPTPVEDELLQNLTWPIVNGSDGDIQYLNINKTLEVQKNFNEENINFYEDLYEQYGDGNYTTY